MSTPFPPPSSAPIYTTAPLPDAPMAPTPKEHRRPSAWKVVVSALAVLILASIVVGAVSSKKDTVATAPTPTIAYRTSTTNVVVPVAVKADMWNDEVIVTKMSDLQDAFTNIARDAIAGEIETTRTDCIEASVIVDDLRPYVAAYNSRAASLLLDALAIEATGFDQCIAGDFDAAGASFSRGGELTTQAADAL